MWITSAIVTENVNIELAIQQLMDFDAFKHDTLLAKGGESRGQLLPPHDTREKAMAAFGPGAVFKRGWDLESSARATVDFINNHSSKQVTATFDGQQEV